MTVTKEGIHKNESNNIKSDKYAVLKYMGKDKMSYKMLSCTGKKSFTEYYIESKTNVETTTEFQSTSITNVKRFENIVKYFSNSNQNEKEIKNSTSDVQSIKEDINSENNTFNVHSTCSVKDRIKFFTTKQKNQCDLQQKQPTVIKDLKIEKKSTSLNEKIAAIQKKFDDSSVAIQNIEKDETKRTKEILSQSSSTLSVKEKVNHFNNILQNTGTIYRINLNKKIDTTKKVAGFFQKERNSENENMKSEMSTTGDLKDSENMNLFKKNISEMKDNKKYSKYSNNFNIEDKYGSDKCIEKYESIKQKDEIANVSSMECPSIQEKVNFFNNICHNNKTRFNVKLNEKIDTNSITTGSFFKNHTINDDDGGNGGDEENSIYKIDDDTKEQNVECSKDESNEIENTDIDVTTKSENNDKTVYLFGNIENVDVKNERIQKAVNSFNYEFKTEKGKYSETFQNILNRLSFSRKTQEQESEKRKLEVLDKSFMSNNMEPLYKKHKKNDDEDQKQEILKIFDSHENDDFDFSLKSKQVENSNSVNSLCYDHKLNENSIIENNGLHKSNLRKFSSQVSLAVDDNNDNEIEIYKEQQINEELYDSDEDFDIKTENIELTSKSILYDDTNPNILDTIFEEDEECINMNLNGEKSINYSEDEKDTISLMSSLQSIDKITVIKERQSLQNAIQNAFIVDRDLDRIHEDLEFWYMESSQTETLWEEIEQPANSKETTSIKQWISALEELTQNLENRQNRLKKIQKQIAICNDNVQSMIDKCNNLAS